MFNLPWIEQYIGSGTDKPYNDEWDSGHYATKGYTKPLRGYWRFQEHS